MPNKTHPVAAGDTFETISTRYFGEPSQSGRIRSANPGTLEILVPGTTLVIPSDTREGLGNEDAGLVMRIDGVSFRNITSFSLTRRIDAVDTVEILAPLAETEQFTELITPLAFRQLEVADGGQLLFRGTMVSVIPILTNQGSTVRIGGYSLPGVLSDCMAPASSYPIQFRRLNIAAIAEQLVQPYPFPVLQEGDVGGPFKRVKLKRTGKILPFLAGLAKQRQLLIRSDPEGRLVIAQPPVIGTPVADLHQDRTPVTGVVPEFAPQNYYSHITGVRSTRRGNAGSQHTVLNPRAQELGIVRPLTISIRDTSKGELPKAVEAAAGRMLAGAVTYTLGVSKWEDPSGARWETGTTLQLEAPSVFIYAPYQFQIRTVKFTRTVDDGDTAQILLMLPGAFGGKAPAMLPWELA